MERKTRRGRRLTPALEAVEARQLLSTLNLGGGSSAGRGRDAAALPQAVGATNAGPARQILYTTAQGTHVTITLYGAGDLSGSSLAPNGGLNLVIKGTNAGTWIVAKTAGGTGRAPLQSVLDANVAPQDLSGIGGSPLDVLNLKNFDLLPGGQINLTAGVHEIFLNSAGANTQVNLREVPESFQGTGPVSTATANGQTLTYVNQVLSDGSTGSQTLAAISGQFVPGKNLPRIKTTTFTPAGLPGTVIAPPGIIAVVNHVYGTPRTTPGLPNPEVFGYDSGINALIRFDAATGTVLQTIPLAGGGTPVSGVGLGRNNGELVALVGYGTTIQAFDAVSGAPVGQFTTSNLASLGFKTVDEIGSTGGRTVIGDASAGPNGQLLPIDVTASLASGQAVAAGSPYAPQSEFELAGGLTGITGSDTVFAAGAAHFNTFVPEQTQFGMLAVNTAGGRLSESSRTPLKINGNYVNVGPAGSVSKVPIVGLGSIDQNLALDSGVSNGQNVVTLYSQNLSKVGTVRLNDPDLLTGLSESFRPGLAGAAVFDVQGNIQSFRANDAQGLVLNDLGNLNLVQIHRASDSTIVGFPFGHVAIPVRSNVTIVTPTRTADNRGGVIVAPNILPTGPLSLP